MRTIAIGADDEEFYVDVEPDGIRVRYEAIDPALSGEILVSYEGWRYFLAEVNAAISLEGFG